MKFHGLRHTFATRLAAAGVPLVKLQEWLGHENLATTQIYIDYQPSAEDGALIERAFGAPPARRRQNHDHRVGGVPATRVLSISTSGILIRMCFATRHREVGHADFPPFAGA
jgi:hypothetical protein